MRKIIIILLVCLSIFVIPVLATSLNPNDFDNLVIHYINGSTSTLYNYPISMIIDLGTQQSSGDTLFLQKNGVTTKHNFDDIRFTQDNQNELSYWVETPTISSNSARFWINMSQINGGINNQTPLYIYYSSDVITESNSDGNRTFDLFDDFIGTTLDTTKWAAYGDGTSVSAGLLACMASGDGYHKADSIKTFTTLDNAIRARIYQQRSARDGYDESIGFSVTPKLSSDSGGSAQNCIYVFDGSGRFTAISTITDAYRIIDIYRTATNANKVNSDGVLMGTNTYTPSTTTGYVEIYAYANGKAIWVDWIGIRKYQSPEPTHGGYVFYSMAEVEFMTTEQFNLLFALLAICAIFVSIIGCLKIWHFIGGDGE